MEAHGLQPPLVYLCPPALFFVPRFASLRTAAAASSRAFALVCRRASCIWSRSSPCMRCPFGRSSRCVCPIRPKLPEPNRLRPRVLILRASNGPHAAAAPKLLRTRYRELVAGRLRAATCWCRTVRLGVVAPKPRVARQARVVRPAFLRRWVGSRARAPWARAARARAAHPQIQEPCSLRPRTPRTRSRDRRRSLRILVGVNKCLAVCPHPRARGG